MTIEEAVQMVDRLKPNHYDHNTKVKWLSKLDGLVWREVILTHEPDEKHHHHHHHKGPFDVIKAAEMMNEHHHHRRHHEFKGYDDAFPDTELLVPFPYDEDVYNYFLQMQIDRENGETAKYNQDVVMYNTAFQAYADWYNRTHKPLPAKSEFKF